METVIKLDSAPWPFEAAFPSGIARSMSHYGEPLPNWILPVQKSHMTRRRFSIQSTPRCLMSEIISDWMCLFPSVRASEQTPSMKTGAPVADWLDEVLLTWVANRIVGKSSYRRWWYHCQYLWELRWAFCDSWWWHMSQLCVLYCSFSDSGIWGHSFRKWSMELHPNICILVWESVFCVLATPNWT